MLRIRLIETFDLVTSGGACSCVLGSLTVVFFTVFLQRDLHFALGNFTVRFTIWGKEDREGEGVYENVLNLHLQHVSIVRQGFRWMTFTFSPLRHAPCAPGVLRMLSKCHCEADYSLHRSSCVRQHAPTIRLPCFSIPARSLVTVLASLMSALRAAEVTRAQEKVAGGGINRRPTRH